MIFDLFGTYNFNTVSTNILKPEYKNVKVVGFGGLRQAIKYSGVFNDVITLRSQIETENGINLIPAKDAKYIFFEDTYGNEFVLAEDWVILDSVVSVDAIDLPLIVHNISSEDVAIIVNTLKAMGYTDIELT
jgi:hypothetical protein